MKNLKYRAAVILLITIMCFSILLSGNIIRIVPVKAYLTWGSYGQGNGRFDYPADVCVAGSFVYVLDTDNDRVQQFYTDGNWIRSWGSTGSADSQFDNPYGICTDASGNVWVADTYNNRIQEFDSAGNHIRSYGSFGPSVGSFEYPWDVAADNSGHIYVSDWYNHRIVKLDVSSTSIDWAGSWGSEGSGNYQFDHLAGIACDADGNVFVADMGNNRVQVFTSGGVFVGKWGSLGSGDGQFGLNSPWGIAVDGAEVYVADVANSRIEKFYFYIPQEAIGVFNWAFGSQGSGQGQFSTPNGVYVDNDHNIYVADSSNNRIQKFNQYTLTLGSNDPSGQSYNYVNPYEGQGKYPEGSVVTLTAVATHGYIFTHWSGWLAGITRITNPTSITMDGDKTVTANFALPSGSVTVTPNPAYQGQPIQFSGQDFPASISPLIIRLTDPNGDVETFSYFGTDVDGQFNVVFAPSGGVGSYSGAVIDYRDTEYLVILATMTFDVSGVSGITVNNVVEGVPPSSDWNYIITELPLNNTVADFTLAAGGGNISLPDLNGGMYLVTETPKFGYYTDITIEIYGESSWYVIISDSQAYVYIGSNEGACVTFTNSLFGGFTIGSIGELPTVDLGYSIPVNKPIPVQATWNTDINNDGKIDLVLGKPTALLVNLTDADIVPSSQVTVKVTFEGTVYTNFTTGAQILGDSIVSIWDRSIIPPSTPKPAAANDKIIGYYQIDSGLEKPLLDTYITVKDTSGLSLTYVWLSRSNYGVESQTAYNQMVGNTSAFMNATYPTKITDVTAYNSIAGAPKATTAQAKKDPYYALKIDCVTAANARYLGGGVGVAIGPNASGSMDYFTYHGFPGAAGFTANPSTKGVIVLDGYYTATAHEVGHTYGLNWGAGNEEYNTNPNKIGNTASGIWAAKGQWIKGYNFMGLAEHGIVKTTWVNQSTYQALFSLTKTTSDPEILLANGLIYENGTVEFLQTWYHLPQGTPDTLTPGNYSLRFVDASNNVLAMTSFEASFFVQIDPGVSVGQNELDLSAFGTKKTDSATFAFATVYPEGTAAVQVVNMTDPEHPVVMATVNAANIINYFNGFLPPINNDGSSVFKLGSTVPVKFQLRDFRGNFISNAIAKIYVAKIIDNVVGTDQEAVSTSAATAGNLFRYADNQYIFNLSTKSLSKGTWQIKVVINGVTTRTVIISLK